MRAISLRTDELESDYINNSKAVKDIKTQHGGIYNNSSNE